ncbi:salivary endonuclease-like [Anticarsia gemmatalis]|uniref:salivary endonuclease-like n=1 Tax=Anticarsia gemmatalis TaxID=129554 RepID=UPI003F7741ED
MIRRIIVLILCALNLHPNPKCKLNSRTDFKEPLPIILFDGKLLEPTDEFGNVELNRGDVLTLSCEGAGGIHHPATQQELSVATITCEGGETFSNDDWLTTRAQFSEFKCLFPPNYSSKRTNRTCYNNNTIIEVGYIVQNQFYPVYESCFNEGGLNAIYSTYTQKPYNAFYQTRVDRPFFIANDNYRYVPVETLFSPRGQKAAVAELVGHMIDTYVTKTEFLSRGHLAAKTDFVFAFGERATFHYVNCAPQWTGFNGGNWNTLEVDLRNHVHAAGYSVIVYTGTYGVSQLFNQFGRRVDLYLSNDENNNPVIPVPQYFYKVVYDPVSKCGIAYIGINNPYLSAAEAQSMFFCENLWKNRASFPWLSWHPDNAHEGYAFCCSIPDFRETVPHLPEFEVNCVLY